MISCNAAQRYDFCLWMAKTIFYEFHFLCISFFFYYILTQTDCLQIQQWKSEKQKASSTYTENMPFEALMLFHVNFTTGVFSSKTLMSIIITNLYISNHSYITIYQIIRGLNVVSYEFYNRCIFQWNTHVHYYNKS